MKSLKLTALMTALIMLVIMSLLLICEPSHAAGNVDYKGNASGFVFGPGSSSSPTDIFPNFKGLMPGDTVTDQVTVKNSGKKAAKIYLRALDPDKKAADLLSQLTLTVKTSGGSTLFDAASDQKAGLADWNLLGEIQPGGSAALDLTIKVPITLDNTYQNAAGHINWQFKAEEEEDEKEDQDKKDEEGPDEKNDNEQTDPDDQDDEDPDDQGDPDQNDEADDDDSENPGDPEDGSGRSSGAKVKDVTTGDNMDYAALAGFTLLLVTALVSVIALIAKRRR